MRLYYSHTYMFHPSVFFKAYLIKHNITEDEFAHRSTCMRDSYFNEFMKGNEPITEYWAYICEWVFNVKQEVWLRIQRNYDAAKARGKFI